MSAVTSLLTELERLDDHAPPGRSAVIRNEAMRLIWRRLRRTETGRVVPFSRRPRGRADVLCLACGMARPAASA